MNPLPLVNWTTAISVSFKSLWFSFINLVPNILAAVVIFIVGLFIAEGLGKLISKILERIYLDKFVEKAGLRKGLEKVGLKMKISKGLGLLVTWFLYLVFLIAIADILNLTQITEFLKTIVLYLPNVIIAIVILVIGVIIGNLIQTIVKEAALASNLVAANFLATVAKWAILISSILAALVQLKVAAELIQILFTGLVAMLALAGGLAFGLGGKEKAAELLEKISKEKK